MADVNKTLKVKIEIDGKTEILELNKAIKALEDNTVSLNNRAKLATGATRRNLEAEAEAQRRILEGLKAQQKELEATARAEDALAKKIAAREKARAQAAELRAKRAPIEAARATQDAWSSGNWRSIAKHYSPFEKTKRELSAARAYQDEQLRLSVYGETPEIRAKAEANLAGAKANADMLAGKSAEGDFILMMLKALKKALGFYLKVAKEVGRTFEKISGLSLDIKENFRNITDRSAQMLNPYTGAASFSANSLVVNAAARRTRLSYGMSSSQAWGFNQASTMFGVSGPEDLLYMTGTQRFAFTQYMQRQEQMFARLERSGVLESIQEMQLDFKLFKQELAMQFLEWVAQNKDLIIGVMKLALTFMKGVLTLLAKIGTLFGLDTSNNTYGFGSSAMSDAASINSAVSNRTLRVSMVNNINGAYHEDVIGKIIDEKNEALVRAVATVAGG